jgi:hypothetical protein
MAYNKYDSDTVNIMKKQAKFNGFFETIFNKYWQTFFFIITICILIIGLQYIQKKLQFSESKMIINWFGFLIIINVILTYTTIIIYQQVQSQPGIPGAPGVQGPIGASGDDDSCNECNKKPKIFEQVYLEKEKLVKQPLLPDKIIVKSKLKGPVVYD